MKERIKELHKEIDELLMEKYLAGCIDILNIFNKKYIHKVWDKSMSDEFFEDVINTIKETNLMVYSLKNKNNNIGTC